MGKRIALFVGLLLLLGACTRQPEKKISLSDSTLVSILAPRPSVGEIFYFLELPVEMSHLFENTGASFNQQLLNPVENSANYLTSSQLSINLGIFGADMSYCRVFDQQQKVIVYFDAIKQLAEKLGLPSDMVVQAAERLNQNLNNPDSVSIITAQVYTQADDYLKRNERDNAAALVILGGWIESMYILSNAMKENPGNEELASRLANQKFSLNSLISFLGHYQKERPIANYLPMLIVLQKSYDNINIYHDASGIQVDTIRKVIKGQNYHSNITPVMTNQIAAIVSGIRNSMIR